MVSSTNLKKHQRTKKCQTGIHGLEKHHIHKTVGKPPKSPTEAGVGLPASPAESKSKNLTEINLKGEYDKMTETLNPKKKNSKEKKYQCGSCGATFDNLNEGKCPDCGEQLA